MHMWMWFGYDLGEFLFSGLTINTRWAFALTWIVLFFVALLFEGSKVYLAGVQREANRKLNPYRSDERRNLLCDREQGNPMEPSTSRNPSSGQVSRWASFRVRALVNGHQTLVFVAHNAVGYLLMLAVMVYNVHLLLAVVFGMMLGYFLFGAQLTRLQMQCFRTKRMVICTPECDDTDRCNTEKCTWEVCSGKLCKEMDAVELQQTDTVLGPEPYRPNNAMKFITFGSETLRQSGGCFYSLTNRVNIVDLDKCALPLSRKTKNIDKEISAENTTPPLLDSSQNSESDFFICQTRNCIQPSHYFPTSPETGESSGTSCYYGAKKCPSKVARAKKIQAISSCHHESEKEDSPSVEDAQLLRHHSCCKKKEIKAEEKCCKSSQSTVMVHDEKLDLEPSEEKQAQSREESPQVTCCHNAKPPTGSQEQIIK